MSEAREDMRRTTRQGRKEEDGEQSGLTAHLTVGTYGSVELDAVKITMDNERFDTTAVGDAIAQSVPAAVSGAGTWTVMGRARYAHTPHFLGMAKAVTSTLTSVGVSVCDPDGSCVLSGTGFVMRVGLGFPRGPAAYDITVHLNTITKAG